MFFAILQPVYELFDGGRLVAARRIGRDQPEVHKQSIVQGVARLCLYEVRGGDSHRKEGSVAPLVTAHLVRYPLLTEEGWTRHQKMSRSILMMERTGWREARAR